MGLLQETSSGFGEKGDENYFISKPKESVSVEKRDDDPKVALISVKADIDVHIEPAGE